MAVTSIWPITNGVRDVIVYACNPEKTTEETRTQFHSVKNVVEYAADELKTEKCEYVDGINCRPDNAVKVFNETRRRWGKQNDKRVCYHGYQSFKADEVDASTAHKIGMELAEKLWGDRFEVIVATHCNTGHYHNHFVLNAVSFVDGKKYCNYKSDYIALREASDEICREHGVSVLDNAPIHSAGNKNEVWLHKKGQLSHRDMLKRDIEYCLRYSSNGRELSYQLSGLGYTIDWDRMSVKGKGWERAVRLANIGFTDEVIDHYFSENADNFDFYALEWNTHLPYKPKYSPVTKLMNQLDFTVDHSNDAATVAVSAVFYIILALFELAKTTADYFIQSHELRYEARNVEKYVSEYRFLQSEQLNTLKDISNFIGKTKYEIAALERERDTADNKRRRALPENKQKYKDERKALTAKIKPLREKLKQAEEIYKKSPRLFDLVKEERNYEKNAFERSKTK